jgi:hypothetical protein
MIGFIDTLYTPLGTIGNYSAIADLHTSQFTVTHTLVFSVFTSHILVTSHCHCSTHKVFCSQPNSFLVISSESSSAVDSLYISAGLASSLYLYSVGDGPTEIIVHSCVLTVSTGMCLRRPGTGYLPRICCPSNGVVTVVCLCGGVFTKPLPSSERLL